ncbi:MAG: hypothetical protein AB8F95_18420 [Bacteroidia bacterium]
MPAIKLVLLRSTRSFSNEFVFVGGGNGVYYSWLYYLCQRITTTLKALTEVRNPEWLCAILCND